MNFDFRDKKRTIAAWIEDGPDKERSAQWGAVSRNTIDVSEKVLRTAKTQVIK